jgi:predicted metal-binding protein
MKKSIKIGIIICDRYRTCAAGKCLKSLRNREGAFARYADDEVELVGYATCAGCPGGNVEYAPAEMKKNGAQVIHFATGLLVGYPPCQRRAYFKKFIKEKYGIDVVMGTHPVPQSYYDTHTALETWSSAEWEEMRADGLLDETQRQDYN